MRAALIAVAAILSTGSLAAAQGTWTAPRTPDGQPDLQGTWTNDTLTPLERPANLGDRKFLTAEEAAALETRTLQRRETADDRSVPGDVGSYNQVWMDSGDHVMPTWQTSLVVDPPNGRVPVRPDAIARRDANEAHETDDPELMSVWDRCISRGAPGWIIPAGYNNAYQIIQTPGYVVIHSEMIHNARIIPLVPIGAPPLPASMKLWEGVSRGHWDGDTLVVETTNFTNKNWTATSAASGRIKGIPQSEQLHIVERFTRVAPDRIDYEARIEDPAVFTQPWTLAFPWMRDDSYQIYEYACHEGNHAVMNILRGARVQERDAR